MSEFSHYFSTLIQKELATYGIQFVVAKHGRDLGLSYTSAASRPSHLLQNRIRNVKNRILKKKPSD